MIFSPLSRSIFRTVLGCTIGFAFLPALAIDPIASPAPTASPDWRRGFTPTQFRQLPAARQPVDPEHLDEPLLAAAIFQAANQQRADLGLPAFQPDPQASAAARLHAEWMAQHRVLAHDEPDAHGQPATPLDRLRRQGLHPHETAENIADNSLLDYVPGRAIYPRLEQSRTVYSYQPNGEPLHARTYAELAAVLLDQWMHSPPHRANLVNPALRFLGTGAALARRAGHLEAVYATQDFYSPQLPSPAAFGPPEATLLPSPPPANHPGGP